MKDIPALPRLYVSFIIRIYPSEIESSFTLKHSSCVYDYSFVTVIVGVDFTENASLRKSS